MDRSNLKKAVRFSSPFETELEPANANASGTIRRESSTHRRSSSTSSSAKNTKTSSGSMDSWDAFDAKMSKSKTTAPKIVENQFLELSVSQHMSLNLEPDDFSNYSFKDPRDLIDRDENERLQFLNSNLSFPEGSGIEQVEAPSLLSISNYFQQGSSFPVPYVGNDSTMMFGPRESLSGTGISNSNVSTHEVKRRTSSQSQIHRRSSSNRSTTSSGSAATVIAADGKPDLSRNNSLAQFFLGPQSNGMKSNDILEYVIDYCKRRASISDGSDVGNSPPSGADSISDKSSEKHDSGIGFANEEKTVIQATVGRNPSIKKAEQPSNFHVPKSTEVTPRRPLELTPPQKDDKEESVMLAESRSLKREVPLFDVSDVGSIGGFEKFKKNLNHGKNVEDRYRAKVKHHVEFEKRRLYVDERYGHPGLSPKGLLKPGSTASLERPSKNMLCNSPPEKLVTSRKGILVDKCESPVLAQTSTNSGGQYHSTPITNESYVSKLVPHGRTEKSKPTKDIDNQMQNENPDKQKRQKVAHNNSGSSSNSHQGSYPESKQRGLLDDHLELKNKGTSGGSGNHQEMKSNSESPISVNRPTSISTDPSKQVLKPSNVLPEGLSILPVIHSGLQQHHLTGQQCACPHQCGQPSPLGMAPGHGPIVIHIHLPCTVSSSGTVIHPTDHRN